MMSSTCPISFTACLYTGESIAVKPFSSKENPAASLAGRAASSPLSSCPPSLAHATMIGQRTLQSASYVSLCALITRFHSFPLSMLPAVVSPKISLSTQISEMPDDSRNCPMTLENVICVWKPPRTRTTFFRCSVFSHCSILALLYNPSSMVTTVYIPPLSAVIAWHLRKTVHSVSYSWAGAFTIGSGPTIVTSGCSLSVVNWLNPDHPGIFWSSGLCWDKRPKSHDNSFLLDSLILFLSDWYQSSFASWLTGSGFFFTTISSSSWICLGSSASIRLTSFGDTRTSVPTSSPSSFRRKAATWVAWNVPIPLNVSSFISILSTA